MAQRLLRGIGITAATLVIAALGLAAYAAQSWDRTWNAPLPDLHASTDPAVIARGAYLVYGPSHCVDCHGSSVHEFNETTDHVERRPLSGGRRLAVPPLGVLNSSNLTPDPTTGIGRYTDPQIARLLRYSVRPDGQASAQPLMPFGDMSDEDVVAVLSFLRAQKPVHNAVAENEWTALGKFVRAWSPVFRPRIDVHPARAAPPSRPTRERGAYLARGIANCTGCHTPRSQLTFAASGPEFSGGAAMEPSMGEGVDPSLWFVTPNLTPLSGSGLMKFPDRDTFVARFQRGGRQHPGSPMPWECYARMSAEDLGALYEFLHSLPPSGTRAPQDPTVPK